MQFIEKLESLHNPKLVIIGGSLPPGVNPEIYLTIITQLKKR